MDDNSTALVLFSGGQDSTVCLAYALATYDRVETLAFDYGQTHKVELQCRATILQKIGAINPDWGAKLGDDHNLEIPALAANWWHGFNRRWRYFYARKWPAL